MAVRSPEHLKGQSLPPFSERILTHKEAIKTSHLENLTISSSPFAKAYSNEDLINFFPENERKEARLIASSTGVTNRYFAYIENPATTEQIILESAQAIALTIKEAIAANKWETIDHLIVTSAFLSNEVAKLALLYANLDPQTVTFQNYRLACAGTATAFASVLTRPELSDKRVIIAAAEPLSALFDQRHFTLEHFGMTCIFSDLFSSLAFIPKKFQLVSLESVFVTDTAGVIKLKTQYQCTPNIHEIASVSKEGVHVKIQEPENNIHTSMNGSATAKFFIRHTPPVIHKSLTAAHQQGVYPEIAIYHQPSAPVAEGINNRISRLMDIKCPPMPFTLQEIGQGNSSSGTFLATWQHLIETGAYTGKETFLGVAPGIGATITSFVARPRS